jgi:hypothetical protein
MMKCVYFEGREADVMQENGKDGDADIIGLSK